MTIKFKKDYIYYAVLLLIVIGFIVYMVIPFARSIGGSRSQIFNLKKETTIALLQSPDQNPPNIIDYYKADLITRDDMISYIVGKIHAKFQEKGVEILDLNPVPQGNRTFVDISFKISNENFLSFLLSLSEIGMQFSVDNVNINQLEKGILVKMRIGF